MKIPALRRSVFFASLLIAASYTGIASAHSWGDTLDRGGSNPTATDYVTVTCFDDGNGHPDFVVVQIEDLSAPDSGLLLSAQVFKDNKMVNTTDTVSRDGVASYPIRLNGGDGDYLVSISKTKAGPREFNLTYHCQTASGVHTGTSGPDDGEGTMQLQ